MNLAPLNPKAVLYARISSEDVSEGYTLNQSIANLRRYAEENGFEILKEFETIEDMDLGDSPHFLEVLSFIEAQPDKVLLIYDKASCYRLEGEAGKKLRTLLETQRLEPKIRSHPCFAEPALPATRIWRYIDLAKFINLLQTQSIFFTRADFLRQMDKQEGVSITKFSKQINKLFAENKIPYPETMGAPLETHLKIQESSEKYNEEQLIKQIFVNCWHMAEFENFAMWKVYSETFGVAIESTYESLLESFSDEQWKFYDEKKKIYIGKVRYIDRNSYSMPRDNVLWPYMHKIREFSYEQELRCVIVNWEGKPDTTGIRVSIDLNTLLHRIHVSPFAPEWFKASIEDLCKKYNVNPQKVAQSNLA